MTFEVGRRECMQGLAVLAVLRPGGASAEEPLLSLLKRVALARATLKTLSGPFTQTRSLGLFASEVRSTGTLTLVAPSRLRWDLGPPDDVSYWVTPEGLAYKSATGGGSISRENAKGGAALADLGALIGGDLSALGARYIRTLAEHGPNGPTLEAVAKEPTARLKRIRLTLAPDLVRPTHVTLYEGARDRTEIAFGELVRDAVVPASRMRAP